MTYRDWRLDGACVDLPLFVIDRAFFSDRGHNKHLRLVLALCETCPSRTSASRWDSTRETPTGSASTAAPTIASADG